MAHCDYFGDGAQVQMDMFRNRLEISTPGRFYQAKLDGRYLASGERDFEGMPELFVITITDYDPFGYDYMMYTVENRCLEVPELEYEDGLHFLYFYTNGSKGGNAEIKAMLNYFRQSTGENAVNESIQEIHEYIEKVKTSAEVKVAYMKYDDLVWEIKCEGRAEGLAKGRVEGHAEGINEGRNEGKALGKAEAILELLEEIAPVPEKLREEIFAQSDLDILRKWHKAAAKAESLEEWMQLVNWQESERQEAGN